MEEKNKKIIGIIGTVGVGKDTAAEYISNKLGIEIFQISQILKDLAKEQNTEPTRENLIQIGRELVEEKGAGVMAQIALDRISGEIGIITGIRVVDIINYMRENSNFILLGVKAEPEVCFERSVIRNKAGEAKTLKEFIENERKENSAPNPQRVFECLKLTDYTVHNNSDLESFYKEIDLFLQKFNLI